MYNRKVISTADKIVLYGIQPVEAPYISKSYWAIGIMDELLLAKSGLNTNRSRWRKNYGVAVCNRHNMGLCLTITGFV